MKKKQNDNQCYKFKYINYDIKYVMLDVFMYIK